MDGQCQRTVLRCFCNRIAVRRSWVRVGLSACLLAVLATGFVAASEPVAVFSGSDSYVAIDAGDGLQIPSDAPLTVEGWIFLRALGTRDMLYSKNSARGNPYTYMFGLIEIGRLAAYDGGAWREPDPVITVATGQWHHLAFSFNGTNLGYYLNGELQGTSVFSFANNTGHSVKLGGYATGSDIDGYKSDLRVWDHAREAAAIQADMRLRLTGTEPGLQGYWPLDEGTGTVIEDRTTNTSHGTLTGAGWSTSDALPIWTFRVAHPDTGSHRFTNTNTVDVIRFPLPDGRDQYQITEGGAAPDGDPAAWNATNPPPTSVTFGMPAADTNILLTAWLRDSEGWLETLGFPARINYTLAEPDVQIHATLDRSLVPGQTTIEIAFTDLDTGTTGGEFDGEPIPYDYAVTCIADTTPDHAWVTLTATGVYEVVLTVTNTAGNVGTATSVVHIAERITRSIYVALDGDNSTGESWEHAFTTIQHAVDKSVAGDTMFIKGGDYPLTDPIIVSGHPGLTIRGGYEGLGDPGLIGATATVLTRDPGLESTDYRRLVEGSVSTMTWERVTFAGARYRHSGGGLYLDHCDATFIECTIRDQQWINPYTSIYGGGLYALGGRIRVLDSEFHNNIMYGGWWHEHGHGAGMAARNAEVFISNTVFSANRMQQRGGSCRGGGLFLENGTATVARCTFTNNWFSPAHAQLNLFDGAGLYARNVRSLTIHDSLFSGNGGSVGAHHYNWFGNAIYLDGALQTASVARVTLIGNRPPTGGANNSSAIYMNAGTASFAGLTVTNNIGSGVMLRNNARFSLTNGLIAVNRGHGISANTGTVALAHATIADNRDPNAPAWGLQLLNTPIVTGTNNIVYHNGSALYLAEQVNLSDTQNVALAYTCSYPLLDGEGNTNRDPEFRDRDQADYRLRPGSAALDTGIDLPGITHDLVGMPRPLDGNGDGTAAADMGAYERQRSAVDALTVNIVAWPAEELGTSIFPVTLHAHVVGANTNIIWFEWDLTGDGEPDLAGPDLWSVDWTFGGGWHDVSLTVINDSLGGVTVTRYGYIRVVPDTVYVSNSGLHRHPFDTLEFAATNIPAAMHAVLSGGTVLIAPDEYVIAEQIPILSPVTLRGMDGWSNTTVRMSGSGRVLYLQHPEATIDGLTLRGGNAVAGMNIRIDAGSLINSRVTDGGGCCINGPVYMISGMVSNCLVIGNWAQHGGGIFMTGDALVTDSTIISNRAGMTWHSHSFGGGVYMAGGTLRNSSVVSNRNWFRRELGGFFGYGGGIYIANGLIENVDVIGNDATCRCCEGRVHGDGGGILQAGGLIDGVTISYNVISNLTAEYAGGIRKTGGILRSAVIAGNVGGGLRLQAGPAENITLVRNWGAAYGGLYQTGGGLTNAIAWHNATDDPDADPDITGTVTNVAFTCTPALPHDPAGSGNITNAPGFRDAGSGTGRDLTGGDFRLHHLSVCIDTGVNQPWMPDARCRFGHPRIVKGWLHQAIPEHLHTVDRGAHEFLPPDKGSLVLIR